MEREYVFTSESVSEGHPDKVADQVADAILDACLAHDRLSRVACEVLITTGVVVVAGEFRSRAHPDIPAVVRDTITGIGYTDPELGFDSRGCAVLPITGTQSVNIDAAVSRGGGEIAAGDQGLMFGYACRETPELMPLPIMLAHRLVRRQAEVRKNGCLSWLGPDAKSQVSVRYRGRNPVGVEKVVVSTQHRRGTGEAQIREGVIEEIIKPCVPEALRRFGIQYIVNPSGSFELGGPAVDTGLTGRKIIVDTYGGSCPHGGGAFSGKDPTKVDRTGAYASRWVAKNIVAAGLAERCTVQVAYAIGMLEPVSILVDLHGTGKVEEAELERAVPAIFDLTPRGAVERLELRRPIYKATAAYGHFGREEPDFTWERCDKPDELRRRFPVH